MTVDDKNQVLITTVPFGAVDPTPIRFLDEAGISYVINPIGRKLKAPEVVEMISDFRVVVAGTEPITREAMQGAERLELISRVGVGLDSVDLLAARELGIAVSYTAEAPAPAVAELTLGLMLSALRGIPTADRALRSGQWTRIMGRRLALCTVGLIGVGRIGGRVARMLSDLGVKIVAHDTDPDEELGRECGIEWLDKDSLLGVADVVSVHVPLKGDTVGIVGTRELDLMKPDAVLINTARGGVVDEGDLLAALNAGRLGGAAMDVFEEEPYTGPLSASGSCILTCHMGSMSADCRARMEIEATQEAIRRLLGQPLEQVVPEEEYDLRREMAADQEAM